MKKIFLSFIAMMIAVTGFAQTSLLATLSHDGTISTYYGTSALKDALAAADNGDAITLSAGQFLAGNITKNITLRGAGMHANSNTNNAHDATIVLGDFKVSQDDSEGRLSVEGISFSNKMSYTGTVKNAMFIKTKIGSIAPSSGTLNNSTFIHTKIYCAVFGYYGYILLLFIRL